MVLFLENQTLISNNFIFIQSSIARTKQMNSSSWGNIVVLLYFELKNNNKHKIRGGVGYSNVFFFLICWTFSNVLDVFVSFPLTCPIQNLLIDIPMVTSQDTQSTGVTKVTSSWPVDCKWVPLVSVVCWTLDMC